MRFDYTTVGHVTVDVMADGTRRPGGGAFYSALQAARLGRRTLIVTRGVREEIEQLLSPYAEELTLEVHEAQCTTTLATVGRGRGRSQRVLAWAGELTAELAIDTEILHLAPVARETDGRSHGRAAFVGVTPQGLVRSWSQSDGQIVPRALDRSLLPADCDAIVISEAPTELRLPDGTTLRVEVPAVGRMCDDIGAGDVFAAAFFIALADGKNPRLAAQFANAAAAVRVAASGASAVGDRAAIDARIARVASP